MRSAQCFGTAEVPQITNLSASASVDFPLPRGPMMHVRPWGMWTLNPGRNPPLISIFSICHIHPSRAAGDNLRALLFSMQTAEAELQTIGYCTQKNNRRLELTGRVRIPNDR